MRTLSVENFSCIESAELDIDRLSIVIGPQASGKSVIAKLCYFANDVGLSQHISLLRGDNLEKFSQLVKDRFSEWFPNDAWGGKKFRIHYAAGDYSITIIRISYNKRIGDQIRLRFSDEFKSSYETLLGQIDRSTTRADSGNFSSDEIERDWRLRELISSSYRKLQGKDVVGVQAFVPAGRSFFTSIGKAIAIFEQGRLLDPLIIRFGRLFTAYKDRARRNYYQETTHDKENRLAAEDILCRLMGGTLKRDGEREYLLTDDGRKVPLAALSSGQQELLPIVSFLPWFSAGPRHGALCYIEEPEAHLFPSTQASLVQALVMIAGGSSLLMTTHSPYVLTKINNLLKAGSLGRRLGETLRKELEAVIPRRAWLSHRSVRAYALKDGRLVPIIGADGFIDGEYLDEISSDLSTEFSKLLELEEKYA